MAPKYYEAYEERYKAIHQRGFSWSSSERTPIVLELLHKYGIGHDMPILEIGCGEGRDAKSVLEQGFSLLATDISSEAIGYCQSILPQHKEHFQILDCLSGVLNEKFDFIYAVAVVHMLVLDRDRDGFYQFIRKHLTTDGIALICTMGDGNTEIESDITQAFTPQLRDHESGAILVAGTSCRMVSFDTFKSELQRNGLHILESGITSSLPDFNNLMYAVVKNP